MTDVPKIFVARKHYRIVPVSFPPLGNLLIVALETSLSWELRGNILALSKEANDRVKVRRSETVVLLFSTFFQLSGKAQEIS